MLTLLQAFRVVALLEGVSFLVLLGVAMPLKYWAGMPLAVRIVGTTHGALFIAYAIVTGMLFVRGQWSFRRAVRAIGAGLLPFGTFAFDRSVKDELDVLAAD